MSGLLKTGITFAAVGFFGFWLDLGVEGILLHRHPGPITLTFCVILAVGGIAIVGELFRVLWE